MSGNDIVAILAGAFLVYCLVGGQIAFPSGISEYKYRREAKKIIGDFPDCQPQTHHPSRQFYLFLWFNLIIGILSTGFGMFVFHSRGIF